MIKECPDSWENIKQKDVNWLEDTQEEEAYLLFTGHHRQDLSVLCAEAQSCAVLDSACSSTVCGRAWLNDYISSLSGEDRKKINVTDSDRIFKFGGGTRLESEGEYKIPAHLAGKDISIKTDVVDSDIPLLLSKTAMKMAKVKLDLENDTAEIFGNEVTLNCTSSGHYCVPMYREDIYVCAVNLDTVDEKDRHKTLVKLHIQFGHASSEKLVSLLKDAKKWDKEYTQMLENITKSCDICKRFAKTPSRPVVALPMASSFNEVVAVDLKKWEGGHILHIIDMWSRFSMSTFIRRKRPSDIIEGLMVKWISIFGVMGALMSDNGGEFNCDEVREVASILNIKLHTTAAHSPYQNGLCERVHGVIDGILHKLKMQYPKIDINILLGWANMAKNSLHINHGFSSHQLVFGRNPNLPNILSDKLPALEGKTMSIIFAQHLNTLHTAREEFIKSEASERIRRALRHKVRMTQQKYECGQSVYYKRDGKTQWLGPAKVVAQDGKLIFIRHGGALLRVTPNRLVECENKETVAPDEVSQEETENRQAETVVMEAEPDPVMVDAEPETVRRESVGENDQDVTEHEENRDIPENTENNGEDVILRRSLRVIIRENDWDVYTIQARRREMCHLSLLQYN
jgi:hypothetical protein